MIYYLLSKKLCKLTVNMAYDECDICGRETQVFRYRIEGAEVIACANCGKHGILIEDKTSSSSKNQTFKGAYPNLKSEKSVSPKPKEQPQQSFSGQKGEKVLIEHYGRVITAAREKMGITRQELAKSLFIRETLLTKIEAENIRPADEVLKKIEKALNIVLFEDASETVNQFTNQQTASRSMTLGDFATIRKKKD